MDVSIRATDRDTRNAAIERHDEEAKTKKKRHNRRQSKVFSRRLSRKIKRQVRHHLKHERKMFRTGKSYGGTYTIDTRVDRHGRRLCPSVESAKKLIADTVATHTGVEIKTQSAVGPFWHNRTQCCKGVAIKYNLLTSP